MSQYSKTLWSFDGKYEEFCLKEEEIGQVNMKLADKCYKAFLWCSYIYFLKHFFWSLPVPNLLFEVK